MRTTVDIDEPVLRELRDLQRREGGTLGQLVSRLLAEALATRPRKPAPSRFRWTSKPMRPRVDLEDKDVRDPFATT